MSTPVRIGLFVASAVIAGVAFKACVMEQPAVSVPPAATAAESTQQDPATLPAARSEALPDDAEANTSHDPIEKVAKTDAEWRAQLSDEEYRILREKGTERAFTGEYWDTKAKGVYCCRACGLELFESDTKFESGCGWPSFFAPLEGARLTETRDTSHGMIRTEITCSRCGSHMGHVFDDGPPPTGLRYCINSASVKLEPAEGEPD